MRNIEASPLRVTRVVLQVTNCVVDVKAVLCYRANVMNAFLNRIVFACLFTELIGSAKKLNVNFQDPSG